MPAIVWVTAMLDTPAPDSDAAVAFWRAVTDSDLSPWRGEELQFATLLPPDGDAHLRVQRLEGRPRVHLDLHVTDVAAAAHEVRSLGGEVTDHGSYAVVNSPAGIVFCLVPDGGERVRQAPVTSGGGLVAVDQATLDVPATDLDRELAFWGALTGWAAAPNAAGSLIPLARPTGGPFRLMLQRIDDGDPGTHLDLAAGPDRSGVVAEHVRLGARVVAQHARWTVMADPAGRAYCLTDRLASTGLLPG